MDAYHTGRTLTDANDADESRLTDGSAGDATTASLSIIIKYEDLE
ncbi:hypothetical protein [Halomarina pelagica]|nr:hypothetical protein [Halomarina sp. BND7]